MDIILDLVGSFALGMALAWGVQAAGSRIRLYRAGRRRAARERVSKGGVTPQDPEGSAPHLYRG